MLVWWETAGRRCDGHGRGCVPQVDEDAATIVVHRGGLRVVANLAEAPRTVTLDAPVLGCVLASEDWSAAAGTTAPVLPARTLAILTVGGAPA